MGKEMSLKEIQEESISILSRIDTFLLENGINYSIGYGSLIGAIRHNGFIPWDDDIDIIVTRPNYVKLLKLNKSLFEKTGLNIYAPELGNNYTRICRITDNSKTVVDKYYQWTDEQTGLWIDVFVIDGIISQDSYNSFKPLFQTSYLACRSRLKLYYRETIIDNLKRLYHTVLDFKWLFVSRKKTIVKILNEFNIDYDSCETVGCYDSPYGKRDIFPKEVFSSYIRVPFESISVSVVERYDIYLTTLYGNYMTLPPKEKQIRSHTRNHYFYRNICSSNNN